MTAQNSLLILKTLKIVSIIKNSFFAVLNSKGSVEADTIASFDKTSTSETEVFNSLTNSTVEIKNITRSIAVTGGYTEQQYCGLMINSLTVNFTCDDVKTSVSQGMLLIVYVL